MHERERVIMSLLDFADPQRNEHLTDQIVHLVLYTIMDHVDAQVRRHGVLVVLHAIHQLDSSREQEGAFQGLVHFAMSFFGGEDQRLAEFFEVLGHVISEGDEEEQLAMAVIVTEVVAQHPNVRLRRAVLGAMLVGIYEDGRNSVRGNLMQQITDIIEGQGHGSDESYEMERSREASRRQSHSSESSEESSNRSEKSSKRSEKSGKSSEESSKSGKKSSKSSEESSKRSKESSGSSEESSKRSKESSRSTEEMSDREFRNALASGGSRARRVIMTHLSRALRMLDTSNEEEAKHLFLKVVDVVIHIEDDDVMYTNLGVILQFIDNIADEETAGVVFASLVKYVMTSSSEHHLHAMRFIIHAVMQNDNERERDDALGYIFYLMVANEDFEARYTFLPVLIEMVFGEYEGASSESMESGSREGGMQRGPLDDEAMQRLAHHLSRRLAMVLS